MNEKKIVYVESPEGSVQYDLKEEHFTIDPSHIDSELCNLGAVMLAYGEIETQLRVEVEQKEAFLTKYKADLDTKIREDATKAGTKLTENKISSMIDGDEIRIQIVTSISKSRKNHNLMQWAMKAIQAKLQCLQALAYRERQLMKADQY